MDQAIALARSVAPDPELLPLAEPAPAPEIQRFDEATAAVSPEDRAQAVAEAIRLVEGAGQTAAGIYSTGQSCEAMFNSRGVASLAPGNAGPVFDNRHGRGQLRLGQSFGRGA